MHKNFSVAAILQDGDTGDEWMFRVDEFYSGALDAWQVQKGLPAAALPGAAGRFIFPIEPR
jgi:hypothetical protein